MEQGRRWLVWLGVLGVLLLALSACGDEGISGQTVITTTPPVSVSTVKLTVSGGLSGTYAITSEQYGSSQYHQIPYTAYKDLVIHVADSAWDLEIDMEPYIGPGAYHVDNLGLNDGSHWQVTFASADQKKTWDILAGSHKSPPCEVFVASDTSWNADAPGADTSSRAELKGTFTCSRLDSVGPEQEQSIAISDGQFDVVAENTRVG